MSKSIFLAITMLFASICSVAFGADSTDYPDANWDQTYGGELNISVFTYRDLNLNGQYDLGDRAMAGVIVEMTGNGKTIRETSNINGFANFRMSATQSKMEVTSPATYRFEVIPPPGVVITSGNAVQTSDFKALPSAPADMFAVTPPIPVGLGPDLSVSGQLVQAGDPPLVADANTLANTQVSVTSPDGTVASVVTDAKGHFEFHAAPGKWTVSYGTGASAITRTVTVKDAAVYLGVLSDNSGVSGTEHVATFDDLGIMSVNKVPSGYAGMTWRNFVGVQQEYYGGQGYVNTTESGQFVSYGGSGHPAFVASTTPFTFVGGYFGVGWTAGQGETLNVRAYRGDQLAYVDQIKLSALTPVYYAPNFSGVTRVEFSTSHYWQFICDDLRFVLPQ